MAVAGDGVGVTARVQKVTISAWLKSVSDQARKKFALLPILQQKGRIKTIGGGGEIRYPISYKYHDLLGHVDGQAREYTRLNELENAVLPWGAYEAVDLATPLELAQNGGEAAIVKLFKDRSALMQKSVVQRIGRQFYNDVDVAQAAIPLPFHGIESFCSVGSQTATDEFQTTSDDTYAGISTARTSLGGASSADEEYGAWSPVIVNCNRTVNGAAVPWNENANEYLRAGLLEAQISQDEEDMVDLVLLRKSPFKDLLNILEDKERVIVTSDQEARKYGFKPGRMVHFEGAELTWDAGCPATDADGYEVFGYGFNTDKVELQLLEVPGATRPKNGLFSFAEFRDPHTMGWLWRLVCFGQLKFEPRYFVKFSKFAA